MKTWTTLATTAALAGVAVSQDAYGSPQPVDSEKLQAAIKLENLEKHAEAFSEIAYASEYFRAAGTTGYNKTVAYIVEKLEALGGYYEIEKQPYSTYIEFFNEAALTIDGNATDTERAFQFSKNATLEGLELVWVNSYGCNGTQDFPAEVEGNIALISRGPEGGQCAYSTKSANAGGAGAAGLIVFDYVPDAEAIFGVLSDEEPPEGPTVPTTSVSNVLGLALAARLEAGETIIVDSFYTATNGEVLTGDNIIATTTGGDPDNILFLGAHLDSVVEGPGINDNGSGSIAILEVALQLARYTTNSTVRFGWWTAEEVGLLGSTYYVNTTDPAELLKIRLYLNFDMIASGNGVLGVYDGDGSNFNTTAPAGSAEIEAMYDEYFEARNLSLVPFEFDGRSDHDPFLVANIPVGGLFTGADGIKTEEQAAIYGGTAGLQHDVNYHTLYDTIGNWSTYFLETNAKAIAHSVALYGTSFDGFPAREPAVEGEGEAPAVRARQDASRGSNVCTERARVSGRFRGCNVV